MKRWGTVNRFLPFRFNQSNESVPEYVRNLMLISRTLRTINELIDRGRPIVFRRSELTNQCEVAPELLTNRVFFYHAVSE